MPSSNVLSLRKGGKSLTLGVESAGNRYKLVVEIDGERLEFPVSAHELGRLASRLTKATDGYR